MMQLTLTLKMTTSQVVKTSYQSPPVNNSPIQDLTFTQENMHHTKPTYEKYNIMSNRPVSVCAPV